VIKIQISCLESLKKVKDLIFFFYEKQNKTKLKINKQKHVKQSKA